MMMMKVKNHDNHDNDEENNNDDDDNVFRLTVLQSICYAMHRFPIHLTFDGDTDDDDPDEHTGTCWTSSPPPSSVVGFLTLSERTKSRLVGMIIMHMTWRHIPTMTRSHGPTMMFFGGVDKEIQPVPVNLLLFNHFTRFE